MSKIREKEALKAEKLSSSQIVGPDVLNPFPSDVLNPFLLRRPEIRENEFLHDYLEAEKVGRMRNATAKGCGRQFRSCPFSVFEVIKKWSKSPQTEQTIYFDDNNEKRDSSAEDASSSVEVFDNEL
ncbi:hypothetical protein QYM36_014033 [Artemia franciscana]|uniref:Uncharacterized protein n=1 Tax=Artemia franciscana TaxID=6661 RepID=A0AA88HFS1_ARTSF|nr:hypothetical protein QYM36_014033 [Artemia franciscana]